MTHSLRVIRYVLHLRWDWVNGTSHSISRGVEYLNLESGVTVVVFGDRIRAARRFSFSAASPEI